MEAASSNEGAPPPNLWGICALAGTHGAGGEWIACGSHAPCNCGGAELHLRTHTACVSCDPIKQRADVWPPLSYPIQPGNTKLPEPKTLGWFFGLPVEVLVDGVAHPLHICLSHATFARQTYGRKPKSSGRSNKARTFGDVCAPAQAEELAALEPHERLYMRRAQVQLHQASLEANTSLAMRRCRR
mmetsp:Transcript_62461/g.185801  ORF Transcript_62461/g.185801 Transcript_62461/m.185801 type:complete len:186 (+) Transcript_62461:375-932(+)